MQRNVRVLGIVANLAPLLGLLGTVLGMIEAFDRVAEVGALGKQTELAGGIAEALLTTAFGLLVAIPSVLLYHYLKGKAESLVREMEETAGDFALRVDRAGAPKPATAGDGAQPGGGVSADGGGGK
jgi:biopolymer transport protein ExbB